MTMCKSCIRKIFVANSEKPEMEKLSERSRNMWKCIMTNVDEEILAYVVCIHVAWELDTTE